MNFFSLLRGSGAPPARLDHARFTTFFGLEVGELLAFASMALIGPLLLWGVRMPEPAHVLTAAFPILWAVLLFVVRFDDMALSSWLGRMIPYWYRQRTFAATRPSGRISAGSELLELALASGENAISWRWEQGTDGVPELHVYESPVRPYRGLLAAAGAPDGAPGIKTRWRR